MDIMAFLDPTGHGAIGLDPDDNGIGADPAALAVVPGDQSEVLRQQQEAAAQQYAYEQQQVFNSHTNMTYLFVFLSVCVVVASERCTVCGPEQVASTRIVRI